MPLNLTGQKFGKLTAINPTAKRINNYVVWHCICDCGGFRESTTTDLRSGGSISCGCLKGQGTLTHGAARGGVTTPTYKTWQSMLARCFNPKHRHFRHYGGRGITVCDQWLTFSNFVADMGERPPGKSLDRYPNNDGNYQPGNCRWATMKQQHRNRSNNRLITWRGKTLCLSEWAELTNLSSALIANRIDAGWPLDRAFSRKS